MRLFFRTLLSIMLLVIAALLILPYLIGGIAQKQFNARVDAFNQQSPYVTITPNTYQRHWFNSTANLTVDFHSPQSATAVFHKTFNANAIIEHGPLFMANKTLQFGRGALIVNGTTPDFHGSLRYVVTWDNHVLAFADIPTLQFTDTTGNHYTATNVHFATREQAHYFSMANMTVIASNQPIPATMAINHVVVSSNPHNINIFIDNASLTTDPTKPALDTLSQITANASSSFNTDQTKLNTQLTLTIQSLVLSGKTITPITLTYNVQGMDATGYDKLTQAIAQLQHTQSWNASPGQNIALITGLSAIFESGFSMSIDRLYVGLPKDIATSPATINASLSFDPLPNLSAITAQITNGTPAGLMATAPLIASNLIKATHAHATLWLPENMIQKGLALRYATLMAAMTTNNQTLVETPESLSMTAYNYLITNKMLVPNNDGSVTTRLTFDQNGFLVNGQKPMFDLPSPTLSMPKAKLVAAMTPKKGKKP